MVSLALANARNISTILSARLGTRRLATTRAATKGDKSHLATQTQGSKPRGKKLASKRRTPAQDETDAEPSLLW
eukprot:5418931-Amphidinium_carterae.1